MIIPATSSSIFFFLTVEDYNNFLELVLSAGFKKHHETCQIPAYVSKKGIIGYATLYSGIFGEGWKIVFANHTCDYNSNSLVTYYTKEVDYGRK